MFRTNLEYFGGFLMVIVIKDTKSLPTSDLLRAICPYKRLEAFLICLCSVTNPDDLGIRTYRDQLESDRVSKIYEKPKRLNDQQ